MAINIGELLRYHRKRSGLSQSELARIAGVGKTAVFDVEHGKEIVQWDTLSKILHALNIKVGFESPLMASFREKEKTKGEGE